MRNRNKTKLSLSHETHCRGPGLVYISRRELRENSEPSDPWHRYRSSELEARPADGCNLRLRIPLTSPLSVPRLGGGFPPTDSRNESDPGAIELRTDHLAISCNWDFAARRKDAGFTASRTHWNWSRDSARGASPGRTKVASLHSEVSRRRRSARARLRA